MLYQLVSLAGAFVVLIAFGGLQLDRLDRRGVWFNALNLVGSVLLLWVALHDRRAGFVALEAIWAAFSIPPLAARARAR